MFALSPALIIDGIIDLTTKVGNNIYNQGCHKLTAKKFDCDDVNLSVVLKFLRDKSTEQGWQGGTHGVTLDTMFDLNNPSVPTRMINIFSSHGSLRSSKST